ncbi:hypothetical protein DPMN_108423 [Dreissena polymorpha]|uniref:Uncharacterized protein n=1 Tax=Dreissena polymorpha TaxID=45954 RepID=A0A9D4K8V7_DREPO|nr:hypothetical protein DPMN_108423 [Dreissena polymorpha]
MVVKAFKNPKIVELPGGLDPPGPRAGLCPAPTRGPSGPLDSQKIFQYAATLP